MRLREVTADMVTHLCLQCGAVNAFGQEQAFLCSLCGYHPPIPRPLTADELRALEETFSGDPYAQTILEHRVQCLSGGRPSDVPPNPTARLRIVGEP